VRRYDAGPTRLTLAPSHTLGRVGREIDIAESGLLVNLAIALLAALIGASVALRLGQSTMVGYIVAGIAIGPFTPGFVGDIEVVRELAEVGVIFLMFAIGARISFAELLRYRWVALIGGSAQVLITLIVGAAVGIGLGWGVLESLFLGAVVSNSSSTVLAKVLSERGEADSQHGHVGLAWSTVQDVGTVVLIVLLTALAGRGVELPDVVVTVGVALLFLVVISAIGVVIIPRFFDLLARVRSREVFIIGVVGTALGVAYLGTFFGISLALGAFLAGIFVSKSDLSHRVVAEALPFRDLFAGLFFVSVGMLVNPTFVLEQWPLVLLGVALIVPIKGAIVGIIALVFRYPLRTSLLTAVVLAQSAEFSFLLAGLGADLGAVSQSGFDLMITSAAISIVLAPILRRAIDPVVVRAQRWTGRRASRDLPAPPARGRRFAVICGYGRVGRLIAGALDRRGFSAVVIEPDSRVAALARGAGRDVIEAPAEHQNVLEAAGIGRAAVLIVAVPDPIAARMIVETARQAQPRLPIVVRTHSTTERAVLTRLGASEVVVGEMELGLEMTRFVLRKFGVSSPEADLAVAALRRR
jgi:CPA2 family monovalent cation:H+ antiporter-2